MEYLCGKIERYCRENNLISEGDGIAVGLSGGADSVFLLYVLSLLKEQWGLRLIAVHVNHGIRGEEAQRDQEYACSFAGSLGIPCKVYKGEVPELAKEQHMTEEEAGRTFRYQCFEECRKESGLQKIAVAHHQEDQAETILFQLLRGSRLRGLGGMRPKRGHIIRPLLGISRKEIEKALFEKQIAYCQDSTNLQDAYSRNLLRNRVIPYLQREIQPAAVPHIVQAGCHLQEIMEFIDGEAEQAYHRIVKKGIGTRSMQETEYALLPNVLQREVILRMIQELCGQKKDITATHIQMVCGLFNGGTGRKVMLPYGIQAEKSYGFLSLYRKENMEENEGNLPYLGENIEFQKEYEMLLGEERHCFIVFEKGGKEKIPGNNWKMHCTKCFDYDRMGCMPKLRFPENGDYMWLDQAGRTKKLSRLFIDGKVSREQRGKTLVLAEGHHILWVPALNRCSAYYYVTEKTEKVVYAYMRDNRSKEERGAT